LRDEVGLPPLSAGPGSAEYEREVAAVREASERREAGAFRRVWDAGRAMAWEQATLEAQEAAEDARA
jgi:hypothetical protein